MKFFTNRSITKKIVIVILTVLMLTFTIPKPVNADFGGILLSPMVSLFTGVVDVFQYLLEWMMLGRANYFMDQTLEDVPASSTSQENATIKVDKKIDGSFFGWDKPNIPDIQYTPEEIFSNRVPALDINFINPSVKTEAGEDWDKDHNIAMKLQPIIASWYVAIRTLALVGLLSVLVYLGIRMLFTSIAADRAKYKKMIMDWLVAMCLLFALHYIMSFALTMSEVVTSLISPELGKTVSVYVEQEGKVFDMNLMNYVRFMIQCTDLKEKFIFLMLYLMLMIYTIRFTWTYLKRVVNMAFLTLIAPFVALTYPIDKVSDGKAQAFNMWIKEFAFNALLQPLHLLLYLILLGSAVELAIVNPLYAIVCLGFILAAEKLLKKMFGFDKAGAGTLGSLAAAAGVSSLANKALMGLGKGPHIGKGGPPGKVRTNDQYQRSGRDRDANKGFNSFDNNKNQGLEQLNGNEGGNNIPNPSERVQGSGEYAKTLSPEEQAKLEQQYGGNAQQQGLTKEEQLEYENLNNKAVEDMSPEDWRRINELGAKKIEGEAHPQGSPEEQEAIRNLGPEEPTFFGTVGSDIKNFGGRVGQKVGQAKELGGKLWHMDSRNELLNAVGKRAIKGVRRNAIAVWKSAPTVAYKAARGTLKTASRVALGGALAATAGVIGATTGDAEKALSAAGAAFAVGAGTGGRAFEATAGQKMKDKSVRDSYGTAKYGSAIDARNARADKAYLKSQEHNEEYEKYWKDKMLKQDYDKAVREYRQVGITDKKQIRNALKLEAQYRKDGKDGGNEKAIRGKVQNIVQTYDNIDKKAVYGDDKATEKALKNIESQLTNIADAKQRRAVANEILQGYRDWYNI